MPRPLPIVQRHLFTLWGVISAVALYAPFAVSTQAAAADGDAVPSIMIAPPVSAQSDSVRAPAVHPNQALTTNALIGYVNSEPVFALDIFRPIDEDLRRLAASSGNFRRDAAPKIRDQIQSYINESLIVTAAQATFTDTDKQILETNFNERTSKLLSKSGGSEAAADKILAASGSTLQKAKAEIRRKLIYDIYMSKNLAPKVVITRQMVLEAYERDPAKWQEKASVELYTITLPVSKWLREPATNGQKGPIIEHPTADQVKAAEGEAMATANKIVADLRKDKKADFARFVEDNDSHDQAASHGGRTPGVVRGTMVNTRLEDYIFSLPADTIGDPILLRENDPTRSSVVVVKIGEKKEVRTISFDEAQTQINNSLRQQQGQELETQYLKKLYLNAAVEGLDLDRMVEVAVDAAVTRYATN